MLVVQFEESERSVVYVSPAQDLAPGGGGSRAKTRSVPASVQRLLDATPLNDMSVDEKSMLWRFRTQLVNVPKVRCLRRGAPGSSGG